MEPTIIEKGRIILIGFSFFGDPFQMSEAWTEENEIERLGCRFIAYLNKHRSRIKHIQHSENIYEVHIEHEETALKGYYEVFMGVEVERLKNVPIEVLIKILPPTQYAVFTLKGEQITSDWSRMIFAERMPNSGYKSAYNYGFNLYDQHFKGVQRLDESVVDVYIPVK